jgi:hypothetical protein
MVSFNCYQEGYENGFRDAMNGKSMSYTGFPKGKAFISGNAFDTYVEGYKKGYADGMAKRCGAYK